MQQIVTGMKLLQYCRPQKIKIFLTSLKYCAPIAGIVCWYLTVVCLDEVSRLETK